MIFPKKRTLLKNNMPRGFIFIGIGIILFSQIFCPAAADEPKQEKPFITAIAEVDKNIITIGDKIKYTIKVRAGKNIDVEFPSFGENLAGFAIKDFDFLKKGFFKKKTCIQWYLLDTYVTGEYTIPEATIKYKEKNQGAWQEIKTNSLEIEVKSVLENADTQYDIRDIKGPVYFPRKLKLYFIFVILFLIIAAAAALAVFFMKKKKTEKAVLSRPAHRLAYEALRELEKKNYIKQGKIKKYYIELSDIARHYLENRFNIKAPEMTTEEFLLKAKEAKELGSEHKNLLKGFLSHCDSVKFAKYGPSEKEISSSFESAKILIDQTKSA